MDDLEFNERKQQEKARKVKSRGKRRAKRNYKAEYKRAKERMAAKEGGVEEERIRVREAQRRRRARSPEVRAREREYVRNRRRNDPEYAKRASEHLKQWRDKRLAEAREIAREWRSQGCCVCGESNPCCIDAHHKDPAEKSASIGVIVNMGLKAEAVYAELEKCIPICANCHRKYHDNSDSVVVRIVNEVTNQQIEDGQVKEAV